MNQAINTCITGLNNIGQGFWHYPAGVFIQSSVLIILLLGIDFLLRKRVRAVFRYCVWMLVFVKLILPPTLSLPTGIGYWYGDYLSADSPILGQVSNVVQLESGRTLIPQDSGLSIETPQVQPSQTIPVAAAPVTSAVSSSTPLTWQAIIFLFWLGGVLVISLSLIQRIRFVRGLIAQSSSAKERLLGILNECRQQVGIRRNIELRLSNNTPSPAVCGLFKPIILMPTSLIEKLSREKLKAVLIHELAHIKRGDVWVNLVQTVLQIIYFYNPFVWLANAVVRRIREQAVDEMVLVALGAGAKSYSNTLIDIADMAFFRTNLSLCFVSVVESKKALHRRIRHMLNRPVPRSSKLGILGLIVIVVIGIILLPMGSRASNTQKQSRVHSKPNTIVPGLRVGNYTLYMSKDEVLRKLGEPEAIQLGEDEVVRRGEEKYSLDNLPNQCVLSFGDISFWISNDSLEAISVRSRLYKLSNGLKVGDSEQRMKQAFGQDFQLEEVLGKEFLCYHAKGLGFSIRKKNQTVAEIVVYWRKGAPRVLRTLPKYDPDSGSPFQVDLRGRDLTKLDLRKSIEDLMYADFDDRTVWPAPNRMPSDFDWQKIMELGKNPGLGVRSLHRKGITGRGVRVAIIDQPLLVDHQEYAERVHFYEEIDLQGRTEPSMHGAAVASIALGKTVGVAPEAELYYIAQWNVDWDKGTDSLQTLARGIHRILEVNEQLPKDNKIRVISISRGWMRSHKDYKEITEAAQKARAAGMLVVCSSLEHVHEGLDFGVLGRSPLADPDVFESYEPGLFLAKHFWADRSSPSGGSFSVPMDSRTTASETGSDKYVFYRVNGFSWAIPYIAGAYALAVQVDPAIRPERFWALAVQTGRSIELERSGERKPLGPIIDPVRLIRAIQAGETATLNRQQRDTQHIQTHPQTHSETQTIVPGVRVGDYTLGMSKDDVLKELGEPEAIQFGEDEVVRRGEEKYSLNNLPREYIMAFGDVSFGFIHDDSAQAIFVRSPLYKLSNGLGVGDSEQKIKQAFGDDFQLEEMLGKDYLCYFAKGVAFHIHRKNQTLAEIVVYKIESDHRDEDEPEQEAHSKQTIVPGVGVGDYTFGMSKQALNKLGQPEGMSFVMDDGIVKGITVHSPLYKFTNGLGVGDSEDKIKQAFGNDFQLEEYEGKDLLTYENKGLQFEIHKKNRTVIEIDVYQAKRNQSDSGKVIMLSEQSPGPITFPKIDRKPKPARWGRGEIKSLPKYDPDSRNGFQVDLRCRDLSKLDLRNSVENLLYADFDDRTVWPASDKMPNGFTWQRFMELGKNPGLGVRTLHERGITGKGVGVAIIDQTLLTEHIEYADSLRLYEENNIRDGTHSSMHGAAVASIAVGKTVGVARDADLYYIATWDLTRDDNPRYNFVFRAQSIRRLLEINRQLPANRKIRVISNSVGWSPSQEGYDEITAACEEAKAAGIFVVSCGIIEPYGFDFGGLGRHPLANPDSFESYGPCLDWAKIFYNSAPGRDSDALWVPEDSRATASFTGGDEYVFYRQGGASWCAPYIAGVYALAAQVEPDITPERFWDLAMKTGRTIELENKGRKIPFGPILDPVKLIDAIKQ